MDRRMWLRGAAAAAWGGPMARVWAAPSGTPDARLLLVFQRGACDGLGLLWPAQDDFLAQVRPSIGLMVDASALVRLDADWRLHPAVAAPLAPWLGRGELAFVPFAGSDDVTRSHFETQERIERGLGAATPLHAGNGSGFLNRLAAQVVGARALAFTAQLPVALRGAAPAANVPLQTTRGPADSAARDLQAMYEGTPLAGPVREGFALRGQAQQAAREAEMPAATTADAGGPLRGEMAAASRGAAPASAFGLQARRVAAMMRSRCAIGFIDVGGWDTHVAQGGLRGTLATRLGALAEGLAGFAEGIGEAAWRRTTVVVLSEFGRTVRENGNRGTDHGHGGVLWVIGGALRGGRPIVGEQQRIAPGLLHQERDLPVLNEYRAVLGGLLARTFDLAPAALDAVFPGVRPADLRLV